MDPVRCKQKSFHSTLRSLGTRSNTTRSAVTRVVARRTLSRPATTVMNRPRTSGHASETELLAAIRRHHTETVVSLLQSGPLLERVELDQGLLRAAASGQPDVCKALLEAGADPAAAEYPSDSHDRLETVSPAICPQDTQNQVLQCEQAAVGGTALHRAVENGHRNCINVLLEAGSKANAPDENGVTSVMLACMRGDMPDVVRMLVENEKCDIGARDCRDGRTSLHCAAQSGDADSLQTLLDAGADIDEVDFHLNTSLMLAVTPFSRCTSSSALYDASVRSLEVLLSSGCFVNLFNRASQTALHRAVQNKNTGAVKILLQYDAFVHDEIVVDACLLQRHPPTLQLLLEGGGNHDDYVLVGLLVAMISAETSPWMMNKRLEQELCHELSRILIVHISGINLASSEKFFVKMQEIESLFGEKFMNIFKDNLAMKLRNCGILGLALQLGKYSVAKMLYTAGADVTLLQGTDLSNICLQEAVYAEVQSLIDTPQPLLLQCKALCRRIGLFGPRLPKRIPLDLENCLNLCDLSSYEPIDSEVEKEEEALMNLAYSDREQARAASQQTLWLYS